MTIARAPVGRIRDVGARIKALEDIPRAIVRNCGEGVIIKNYTGAVKAGNLLFVGQCSVFHGDVARVIESAWQHQ